jgi:two-component system, OmpR family, alkaline phosphatase synthesis response regulator PhoP
MEAPDMAKHTVLIVDDDVDFLQVNRTVLEAAGFQVLLAHNSGEGMKLAQENHVDVAVLDVMMDTPDEGFVLAREMRKDEKTKNIPLVMLTAINEVNKQAGYTFKFSDRDKDDMWLPVDKFLDKPIKPQHLAETVSNFMR